MKIGLIRYMHTESVCPAAKCFAAMRAKSGAFEGIEEAVECVAVNTRGGCPAKNAAQRGRNMVALGAEAIAIASCATPGKPLHFPWPFHRKIMDIVKMLSKKKQRFLSLLNRSLEIT